MAPFITQYKLWRDICEINFAETVLAMNITVYGTYGSICATASVYRLLVMCVMVWHVCHNVCHNFMVC